MSNQAWFSLTSSASSSSYQSSTSSQQSPLSEVEVVAILDKLCQLKEGGKLCFKGNEVSIESSNSLVRTGSSWLGHYAGSGWSRDINDLTPLVKKVSQYFDQKLEGDKILILADKIQSAIRGLQCLKSAYASQPTKAEIVDKSILDLHLLSSNQMSNLILIAQQFSKLEIENADLRVELDMTKQLLQEAKEKLNAKEEQVAQTSSSIEEETVNPEEEQEVKAELEFSEKMQKYKDAKDERAKENMQFRQRLEQYRTRFMEICSTETKE